MIKKKPTLDMVPSVGLYSQHRHVTAFDTDRHGLGLQSESLSLHSRTIAKTFALSTYHWLKLCADQPIRCERRGKTGPDVTNPVKDCQHKLVAP